MFVQLVVVVQNQIKEGLIAGKRWHGAVQIASALESRRRRVLRALPCPQDPPRIHDERDEERRGMAADTDLEPDAALTITRATA